MLPLALLERHAHARKVVEIGAGTQWGEAQALAKAIPGCEVWVTDSDPRVLEAPPPLRAALDDAAKPRLAVYAGAALVYSVRAPEDIQVAASQLAQRVGAELALKPLGQELAQLTGWPARRIIDGWHWFSAAPWDSRGSR